ncbi:hypothetical protein BAY61_30195 [Prauserella marina]|uniref:Uncharacterized protein n=1 Tax=Prauserella marina TaxID=530584 RepID=A0A222VXX0_9PSEU|nr:GntR family transcriptional regulator [Prauserella marina]ASR38561.1 hypothetical protein BAY61_30195 [Prauserella marina]PWV81874.1 regulatory GntR family protein [Prauserella marina]SDD14312.1 GntR family transcriptional regulator, phosphonate transport system regulatory protein/GntR family transcriptional regulator/GntR family transcriptional regulator, frlABCD operon transcriptional regulator [Prauserella marina]
MSWNDRSARIDHDGPDLLWEQVATDIRDDVKSGSLKPGAKLPGELELADIYGVARVTVRRAVLELRKEGFLRVTHGRGTFVAKPG